ncbi:MAG: hypothetical protein BM558_10685 [Roseobacter sp. MedPE-SW]|nr:MAG: hypothetical protein BM558_10685 [Roseobacter sp. MedPE-SW]
MIRFFVTASLVLGPISLWAKESLSEKFEVKGSILIYDTEKNNGEILDDDIRALKLSLRKNTEIKELQLNSSGGSVHAGTEMAQIVMKYQLDTYVEGECTSACVDVFLAGNRRHMARGAKIGFHQRSWASEAVQRFYRSNRNRNRWDTPFEFGSWIYADTQAEIHAHQLYMVSRGVDPGFVVTTLQAGAHDVWYPTEQELVAAGVLREAVPGGVAGQRQVEEISVEWPPADMKEKKQH